MTKSSHYSITIANPREGERYYERLLLNHVRGPLSFNDLFTVNGRQCDTFKDTAKERGLLELYNSILECLGETVIFKMQEALRSLFATILAQSNPEQEQAFTKIVQTIDTGTTGIFFVDGPGGTGKIYLYCALLANVRSRGMTALATTISGVAASILPGGRTAHSRFEIPLQTNESTMTNMSKKNGAAKLIRKEKVIIWDEAPMAKRQTIETVDRRFRDIMDIDKSFGGKVMVFGGYFHQMLPVVPKSTRAEIVNASLVKSYLLPLIEKIQVTRNNGTYTKKHHL
ncbi:uncharacterized protein LOC125868496 [Solanum stenotomum]|uniref:uncharacterized protein LOC125868496 n=1 Tax=Solanum stenotomum TaxID=172797 RepID=UPI0020D19C3F|nr:uncharacterized protein LOC125868496 [Solanum stenotomum]